MPCVIYKFSCAHGGNRALDMVPATVNVCVPYACGKHKRDVQEEKGIWFAYLQLNLSKRPTIHHSNFMYSTCCKNKRLLH